MFFYIGNTSPLKSLQQVTDRLYLDLGWSSVNDIWYKGYSTDCKLIDNLDSIVNGYQPAGKWCVIHKEKVYHPVLRGFPLYITEDNDGLTNIKFENSSTCLYHVTKNSIDDTVISMDEAATIIGDILLENTVNFYKYNDISEINVLYSAGLDTLTSWAVLDHYTKDYTLTGYVPQDTDDTLYTFLGRIREYESDLIDKVSSDYWGYDVSSFFKETNWYLTGYYAEMIQFRDGEAINALANFKGKRIDKLASKKDYLYWFLKRPNIVEKYKDSVNKYPDEKSLKEFLYETIYYDHQMWHLDNNLTFNPFFDIRIPNTMMRLSIKDITKNSTTGIIQRKIVERFNPQLLSLLSDYKNEQDVWGNFKKNWSTIKLDPMVKINIR